MFYEQGSQELWNILSERVQSTAQDKNGEIWAYADIAFVEDDADYFGGDPIVEISGVHDITILPDWRNSLRKRPKVWERPNKDTPVDAPVWWWVECRRIWIRGHYAGDGKIFTTQRSSWTTGDDEPMHAYVVLPDEAVPNREPDFVPDHK